MPRWRRTCKPWVPGSKAVGPPIASAAGATLYRTGGGRPRSGAVLFSANPSCPWPSGIHGRTKPNMRSHRRSTDHCCHQRWAINALPTAPAGGKYPDLSESADRGQALLTYLPQPPPMPAGDPARARSVMRAFPPALVPYPPCLRLKSCRPKRLQRTDPGAARIVSRACPARVSKAAQTLNFRLEAPALGR